MPTDGEHGNLIPGDERTTSSAKALVSAVHQGSSGRSLPLSTDATEAANHATTDYCADLIRTANRTARKKQADVISTADISHAAQQLAISPKRKLWGFLGTLFGGACTGALVSNIFSSTHQVGWWDLGLVFAATLSVVISYRST